MAWTGGGGQATALLVTGAHLRRLPELAVVPASALAVADAVVPMAGDWQERGGALRFIPRLGFVPGVAYALVHQPAESPTSWTELDRLTRPAVELTPTALVTAIHPDVPQVPENLLRLAVTFSTPMEEGAAAGHVHLLDAGGERLPHTLHPMPPELWDRARRRLTLLLEPGRIKRGLVPNTELGAPLTGRDAFELLVERAVRDAAGADLAVAGRRSYRVGPPVRARVDPSRWRVRWPPPDSDEALVVDFDRPLDHALALRCITVAAGDGALVAGAARLDPGQIRWSFHPASAWSGDGVRLRIDTALEDLAGNSVRRVFDRDLQREQDDPVERAETVLAP